MVQRRVAMRLKENLSDWVRTTFKKDGAVTYKTQPRKETKRKEEIRGQVKHLISTLLIIVTIDLNLIIFAPILLCNL